MLTLTPPENRFSLADGLRMIREEYLEMPRLHLTSKQAQRLWNLDSTTCESLLGALVQVKFLRRSASGGYVRADRD